MEASTNEARAGISTNVCQMGNSVTAAVPSLSLAPCAQHRLFNTTLLLEVVLRVQSSGALGGLGIQGW